MLKEIWGSEESRYPVNSLNAKNTSYHDKKNYDKCGYRNYQSRATNIWEELEEYWSDSLSEVESEQENDDVQQDSSYHISITTMADEGEDFFGKCYNCGEPGHPWCDCKKPLKPALKLTLKSENDRKACQVKKKQLNQTGGTGVKGGHIPKALPAPAQN